MGKRPSSRAITLVHYDGQGWLAHRATLTDSNTILAPWGELAAENARLIGDAVYLIAATMPDLLSEADFESARHRVVFSALFRNDSDVMEFARNALVIATFVVSMLVWWSLGGIGSQLTAIAAKVVTK